MGAVLGLYWTSGINFEDLGNDLSTRWQFEESESTARRMATGEGTSDDSRNMRGQLHEVVTYGQMGVDGPTGLVNRTAGQVDQATGYGEANFRGHLRFGTDQDGGTGGVRRLETLDRGDSRQPPDTGTGAAERRLLGSPTEQPGQTDASRPWYRPEGAPPPRSESDTTPQVPSSSAVYFGRDSSGNPVYVLGTPASASKPEQAVEVHIHGLRPPPRDDGVAEVHVHGVRPSRPPKAPPPRPENSPDTDGERNFWNRGGAGLLLGTATGAIGVVIILSNPVGWVAGLTGALMLASGAAASLSSGTELGASYTGKTTAAQDAAMNEAVSATLGTSSPGGLLGGVAGTVYTGTSQGFEQGAFLGGLAEGAVSLGAGAGRMGARELRFGRPRNMNWGAAARARNQQVYDLGDVAARSRSNPHFPRSVERIELSHTLPRNPAPGSLSARVRRSIGPRQYERIFNRPFNVTPMWATEHALIDPRRYQFMKAPFQLLYPPLTGPARWARLLPPWLVQSSYGGVRIGLTLGEGSLAGDNDGDTETDTEADTDVVSDSLPLD
ncbi:hypothetical protein [Streptomyces lateritius]|uniref:hypothetical protein n=1 Tax=Streptomyces lateritius TaxID=67313 RepID=UPI00167A5BB9|nr:hypothetical protein [Streptomyces lateritius]